MKRKIFLCEGTNVSSDWPNHLKEPENELMIKFQQKRDIKRMKGKHLCLKAFF